jgi:hypothetical protein
MEDPTGLQNLKAEIERRGVQLPLGLMPLGDETATLRRFLKARKFNVTAAADMLQNTCKWRAANNIDGTLEAFLPDGKDAIIRKHLPGGYVGFDKEGQPVWMEHAAAIDVVGMEAAGVTLEDYVFYQIRAMEYMVQCKYPEATKRAAIQSRHTVSS